MRRLPAQGGAVPSATRRAEQDGRKVNPLGTIRSRQTAFAGVALAGENRSIAEIRLAGPA